MSINVIKAIMILNAKKGSVSKGGKGKTKGWTDEARKKAALTRKAKSKVKAAKSGAKGLKKAEVKKEKAAPKETYKPASDWHVSKGTPNEKGQIKVPKELAQAGYDLAMKLHSASNRADGASARAINLQWSKKVKDKKAYPEARAESDKAWKVYHDAIDLNTQFKASHGIDTVDAHEAVTGREWPYYKVNSNPGQRPKYASE